MNRRAASCVLSCLPISVLVACHGGPTGAEGAPADGPSVPFPSISRASTAGAAAPLSLASALGSPGQAPPSGYLHVDGATLKDEFGNTVRLTGVNWFGFETSNMALHGLWSRDYKSVLQQIRDIGFNVIRMPFSDAIVDPAAQPKSISFYGTDAYNGKTPINEGLAGKSSLEVLDEIVREAGALGLRIILDNHSREPDAHLNEQVWYTPKVSEAAWIANWVALARRYKDNPVVVGFDLDNEPHGMARWGEGDPSVDWRAAAERCGNAILKVNPGALIVVEGVESYQGAGYWWGGNLQGAKAAPVVLSDPTKLVYSPHEYGPEVFQQKWFDDPSFPTNMKGIWDAHFGYLASERSGHLLVGEFGIRDQGAYNGKSFAWFSAFLDYAGASQSWTFWCMNPNSGDTGGILKDDWVSVNQWKVAALQPYLAPLVPAAVR